MVVGEDVEGVRKVVDGLNLKFEYGVADPTFKLTKFLRKSDLPSPVITGNNGDDGYTGGLYLKYANMRGCTEGLLQPSFIVLNEEMKVLFDWKIEPKLANLGGATDRPDVNVVVQLIEDKVNGKKELFEIMNVEDLSKTTKVESFGIFDLRSFYYALFGLKQTKE